jgi:hypothetical protein
MESITAKRTRVEFQLTHPNAAGIDIGSASHWVAVPADRADEPVREFESFTDELNRLADWLEACAVDTVAMESAGVYWIPLFELLEGRGFTVFLVNARNVKNVSGRKSEPTSMPVRTPTSNGIRGECWPTSSVKPSIMASNCSPSQRRRSMLKVFYNERFIVCFLRVYRALPRR